MLATFVATGSRDDYCSVVGLLEHRRVGLTR